VRTDGRSVFLVHLFGPLAVLDAATGAIRWSYAGTGFTRSPGESFRGAPALDDDRFFVTGFEGNYAFRKE
jgi:hypothetical protein